MDGVLIIDKHEGPTSHDVVARVRRILKTRRVGHTGTLDPFATGVLVLLIGKATRLAQFLDKDEKEYEAAIRFGYETDTGDRTGAPRSQQVMPDHEVADRLASTDWNDLLAKFRGDIMQTPPMYSAKKIAGKKLYELAREGVEVSRRSRPVFIRELDCLEAPPAPDTVINIRVVCSAGTYVRTLAEDIGREVGVGAHLGELRRARAGRFSIEQAITLEQLGGLSNAEQVVRPMSEAVAHLPELRLSPDRAAKTKDGLATRLDEAQFDDGSALRMLDERLELLAIGIFDQREKIVKPKIVLV